MRLNRSKFDSKDEFFWHILNDLGCSDFALAYSFKRKDGSIGFSKWVTYMSLLHLDFKDRVPGTFDTRQQFIQKASHRTILDIEILIDIDGEGQFKTIKNKARAICRKLTKFGFEYTCCSTGSKGYHISLLFPTLRGDPDAQIFRSSFLSWIGADVQKASSRAMIALEGEPHWKSGIIKAEVGL